MSATDITCPNCAARNPATAEWCSQCYDPLGSSPVVEDVPATRVADPTLPPPAPAAPAGVDPVRRDDTDLVAGDGRFRTVDGVVEWRCATCDSWNPVDRLVCTVCATPLDGSSGPGDVDLSTVDRDRVMLASWVVPGGGQWLLGQRAKGLSRLLIAAVWLVGALMLLVSADGGEAALLPVGVLVAGVVAVWGLSVADARTALSGGTRELLGERAFLWVVVGVLGAVIASMVLQALGR